MRLRSARSLRSIAFVAPLTLLAACDADTSAWDPSKAVGSAPPAAEAGYVAPPSITWASAQPQGQVLIGAAAPGARVRLGPPQGEAVFAMAGRDGVWTVTLPRADTVRLFGVSMSVGDRAVQAEGYLMVLPDGRVLQLRAGAGASSLSPPARALRLQTVDHDVEGGAVIAGAGPAGGALSASVDRTRVAEGVIGPDGHFMVALSEPLGPGDHDIELTGGGGRDSIRVPITRAEPLAAPFRGARTAYGWRVDWMTPAGGLQSTLVFDRAPQGGGA